MIDAVIRRRRKLFADRLEAQRAAFQIPGWWAVTEHWLDQSRSAALPAEPQLAYLSWPVPSLRRPSTWDSFVRWHNDRCAVCGVWSDKLYDDHDHTTHLVRGLLCPCCNRLESITTHAYFDAYRLVPPAAIWGLVRFYNQRPDRGAIMRALGRIVVEGVA